MNNPYKRKTKTVETEEWYGQPPPQELGTPPVPTLVGDGHDAPDDEDDLDDEDLDDCDDEDDDQDDRP